MMEAVREIPDHVARIVRDAALKNTERLADTAWDVAKQRVVASKTIKPAKVVETVTKAVHTELSSREVALLMGFVRNERWKKRTLGVLGFWTVHDDFRGEPFLYAHYSVADRKGSKPIFAVRVAHHALERVATRLGTIDQAAIRNELASACNSLFLAKMAAQEPANETTLKMVTPQGVAVAVWKDAGIPTHTIPCTTITTWLPFDGPDSISKGSHWIADEWTPYEEPDRSSVRLNFVGGTPSMPLNVREKL